MRWAHPFSSASRWCSLNSVYATCDRPKGVLVSIPLLTVILWLIASVFLDFGAWNAEASAIFLGIGLIYPAFVTLLTYEANRIMGPGAAGALGNLAPLFAVAGAAILIGELPRMLQLIGILVIVVGVILLSMRGARASRAWPYWAIALPVAASAIRGIAQPVTKTGLALWPNPFAALLLGFTASAFVVAVASAIRNRGWPRGFTQKGVFWFGLVGLSNGMAVLCLYAALTNGSVVLVAPLTATYPLFTVVLSALLLQSEPLTVQTGAGVAITVVGVTMLFGK